ncbi:MAG: hypothetical protein JNK16_07025, partial [Phycisphaerales bacterium]|nr:hypothetical protein [Phycisphaerales bacterium]
IVLVSSLLFAALISAGCSSNTVYEQPVAGANYEVIELKNYQARAAVPQDNAESCWAACVQSIQKYSGRPVETQEQIAARIRGSARESKAALNPTAGMSESDDSAIAAAGQMEIMRALAPDAKFGGLPDWNKLNKLFYTTIKYKESYLDPLTNKVKTRNAEIGQVRWDTIVQTSLNAAGVVAAMYETGADRVVSAIEKNQPAVAGFSPESQGGSVGHAVVVCGIERRDTTNQTLESAKSALGTVGLKSPESKKAYAITRVFVMDPDGGTVRPEDAQKFESSVNFILTAADSKAILEKLYHLLPEK